MCHQIVRLLLCDLAPQILHVQLCIQTSPFLMHLQMGGGVEADTVLSNEVCSTISQLGDLGTVSSVCQSSLIHAISQNHISVMIVKYLSTPVTPISSMENHPGLCLYPTEAFKKEPRYGQNQNISFRYGRRGNRRDPKLSYTSGSI